MKSTAGNASENMYELRYRLESQNDGTDMTDRIEQMLRAYGTCLLGSGVYVVSGVNMPDHSTLMGMGDCTKIILKEDISSGYAVRMGSFCCVKNLSVLGSRAPIALPDTVGERHGILFAGTATTKDWMGPDLKLNAILEGCRISGFTGGGLTCVDTGYYVRASLTASNCHIINCGAGINISHFSEYHEFTNMLCSENLYGCINNGGNNVFVNCGFNANRTAFVIDNAEGQSCNNSHGSAIGCTFNHSGDNKGIGIMILGAKNGYVFSGCQMFYSKIILENAEGITFNAMNFSKNMEISVKGGGLILFTDSVFSKRPTSVSVTDNSLVKFINCFTREGEEIKAQMGISS
ncbi:MAG: hypothetical protein IJX39_10230 [Clostridia bacterium]|nr:hypothetical protein [Clostridia bacterium]